MATRKKSLPTPSACAFAPTGGRSVPAGWCCCPERCRGPRCPWASAVTKGKQRQSRQSSRQPMPQRSRSPAGSTGALVGQAGCEWGEQKQPLVLLVEGGKGSR